MARNKTLRTLDAGALVEQVCYTRIHRSDDENVRSIKKEKTSEVMKKYNHKASIRKFELMLAANFRPGDIVGVVTYDDKSLPESRKAADRKFRYFRQKLAAHYKARGVEMVVFWSTEHKHGDGRWHHHFILPSTGDDYDAIRDCWIYGDNVELSSLRVDKVKNYATLASYYAKEAREKVGLRSWSYTRNAKKPIEETDQVEDDYQIQPPMGVLILEHTSSETPYGRFEYLKYLRHYTDIPRPRARKRRRKVCSFY